MTEDYSWAMQNEPLFDLEAIEKPINTDEQLPGHILFERKPGKRRLLQGKRKEELAEIMPGLPPVDTDYYIVATGRGKRLETNDTVQSFGFGAFIDYVTSKMGGGCTVYISTWSMNRDHAILLEELLSTGQVKDLHMLIDRSFFTRESSVSAVLVSGIQKHPNSRIKSFRNHSKLMCIKSANDDNYCVITGSANLSGTPRAENYTVSSSPEMYHFFVNEFFEAML